MFNEARIKLTGWYLLIIMAISLSFSGVIYFGINRELNRIESFQKVRIQRIIGGFPTPPDVPPLDTDAIAEARQRLLTTLGMINLLIFALAGAAGYFLAGRTLRPIAKMVEDQKSFVSDASHELRTPITSLKTQIEVALRDKKLTIGGAKGLLRSSLEEVEKMRKLSNYLLRLNRYEGGSTLSMTKVDLKRVVFGLTGKMKVKTNLRKAVVRGNEDAISELVTILLDNAVKYGAGRPIEVRTGGKLLEIEDHGAGISKEDLPHIFDRFYRSDKSRGSDGYGLGLSIAKSIADAHGATINVVSKLNKGSTFRVTFL